MEVPNGKLVRVSTGDRSVVVAHGLPDGSLVFVSSRDGQNNIYRLRAGATDAVADVTAVTQLTRFAPGKEATIGHGVRDLSVNATGTMAVFCVWDTLYTLDLRAATPEARAVAVRVGGDTGQLDVIRTNLSKQVREAALSPDGKTMAVAARGEIFVRSTEKDRPTRRVTAGAAKDEDVAWSPDGKRLYFVSDGQGTRGVYMATVAMSREDVAAEPAKPEAKPETKPEAKPETKPTEEPAKGAEGEVKGDANGEGEKKEPEKKESKKKVDEGKRWAEALTFTIAPVYTPVNTEIMSPRFSPDGKRVLLTRNLGDLLLAEVDDEGRISEGSVRVVFSGWNEPDVQWSADSRHIVYAVEDLNFNSDVFVLDLDAPAGSGAAAPVNLTRHPDLDHSPRLSADGKVLAFLSDRDADSNGRDDVYIVTLDRTLDGLRPYELAEYFKDAAEKAKKRKPLGAPEGGKPAGDGEEKPEAKAEPAGGGGAGGGGPGGRGRRGRDGAEDASTDDPPASGAKEPEKKDAKGDDKPSEKAAEKPAEKKETGPSPKNPLKFDSDDAWKRVRKVVDVDGGGAGTLEIAPGGERIIFSAGAEGQGTGQQLVSVDYKGSDRKVIAAGGASNVRITLAGDKVTMVQAGEAAIGKPGGGEVERQSIDAPVTIEVSSQQRQKFIEAARTIGQKFYHPTLKGLDWSALTARYVGLVERTRTDTEFNRVFMQQLGELNGSHLGITGGRSTGGAGEPCGTLGIESRPTAGGFEVTRILAGTPADKPVLRNSHRLEVGDVITAVNGRALGGGGAEGAGEPTLDLLAALAGTVGQETLLTVRAQTGTSKNVLIVPQGAGADTAARYADEVRRNTELVDRLSGGRLGYLHIRGMDLASTRDFERDLFAAAEGKDGLLIDVRDNGGGSTADILLASLTAPRHAYTAPRGTDPTAVPKDAYPRDRRLIYGYTRPLSVLINANSFSNAEIFAHAIKTTGRGKVVGTATYGGVISTGAFSLIDGTTVRLPFRGWYLPNGKDMENNGTVPDIDVERLPQDDAAGNDRQLEAAVKELLDRAAKP
ncbi:MAG: S41 family peptidase [Phycisphaerales bacterium]